MQQSNNTSNIIPNKLVGVFGVFAILGFIDAAYLTVEHFLNALPPCAVGSCEQVLTSVYSSFAGIPTAFLGSLYYLTIIVLVIIYFDMKRPKVLRFALRMTWIGLITSFILFLLQALVIHAYCLYCLISAVISTILFLFAMYMLKKYSYEQ